MTRHIRSRIFPTACTAVLLMGACRAQECGGSPSPAPSASPSPSPTATSRDYYCPAPFGRWAAVVIYEKKPGVCARLATPPRVYARHGDEVIWRIYNQCSKEQTIRLADFVHHDKDPGIKSAEDDNYEQLAPREAPKAKEAASPSSDDPFEGTGRKLTVKAGGAADLKLTVKGSVATGVYTYVTYLSDKPDADQQIEIWP